ncbi:ATP-dependent helicase, partial [Lactobacillus delbrueckii subsp. lactis]|nr:ATP-dependent helicase [Lactobacillus delbrueckii subsp. lactis]
FFDQEAYLEDSQQLRNLDQEYQFGNALALASDRVYISYPVINSNNDLLDPSIYYKRLLKLVNGREYRQRDLPDTAEKDRTEFARQLLLFLTSPRASLGYLAYAEENSAQSPLVAKLVELSRQYEEEKAEEIAEGMAYDNNPQDISEDLAERLYGKDETESVSQ